MTATVKTQNGNAAEQADGAERSVFGNVETAPVKVSEIAKPQAADQPKSVGAQVEEPVTKAIQQGETRVELQLEPAHLGKVTVELTQREDGTIHVALYAENGQTRGLLEKDMSGLQQLLNRNTQQEVQVEVPRYQENQQQDLRDGHQQENQHRQQQQQRHHDSGEDFLSRLRLGLIPMEEEAS
jgi:flagellar hook-length control protein FliK